MARRDLHTLTRMVRANVIRVALSVLCAAMSVHAFLHGETEQNDDPARSKSAQKTINRLWSAARERADVVRSNHAQAQGRGETYSPTNADMFGSMLDYMKDKITTPPLLSTEQNFVLLHKNILALATEVSALRVLIDALLEHDLEAPGPRRGTNSVPALHAVLSGRLVPVQGPRYTIIGNTT
jgi:hypothetical protein